MVSFFLYDRSEGCNRHSFAQPARCDRQGPTRSEKAVWSYEEPNTAVAQIRSHLVFYPDRVDKIEEVD